MCIVIWAHGSISLPCHTLNIWDYVFFSLFVVAIDTDTSALAANHLLDIFVWLAWSHDLVIVAISRNKCVRSRAPCFAFFCYDSSAIEWNSTRCESFFVWDHSIICWMNTFARNVYSKQSANKFIHHHTFIRTIIHMRYSILLHLLRLE